MSRRQELMLGQKRFDTIPIKYNLLQVCNIKILPTFQKYHFKNVAFSLKGVQSTKRTITLSGWMPMDDSRFYVLFNIITVISGPWAADNKRLCAMEPRLRLNAFRIERGSNSGPLQRLIHSATGAPNSVRNGLIIASMTFGRKPLGQM